MKKEELFRAIGEIDDATVISCEKSRINKTGLNKTVIRKALAVCAAVAIVLVGAFSAAKTDFFGKSRKNDFVPTLKAIEYCGSPFSQEEIYEVLENDGKALIAEYESADAKISDSGFYLLNVTENGNYMNYKVYIVPVLTEEKVTSFLEISRGDEGKLTALLTDCENNTAMTEALNTEGTIAITVDDKWPVFITPDNRIISYTGDASLLFSESKTEYLPREDYYSAYKAVLNSLTRDRENPEKTPIAEYVFGTDSQTCVSLYADNIFSFEFSPISSYIAIGTYEISGEKLILTSSDADKNVYIFYLNDEGLVFDAESSKGALYGAGLTDGSVMRKK